MRCRRQGREELREQPRSAENSYAESQLQVILLPLTSRFAWLPAQFLAPLGSCNRASVLQRSSA